MQDPASETAQGFRSEWKESLFDAMSYDEDSEDDEDSDDDEDSKGDEDSEGFPSPRTILAEAKAEKDHNVSFYALK